MSTFGELILVLGDFHTPNRVNVIPEKFKRMLVPNKMQHVICTGNLDKEQYEELRGLAPNVHIVSGDYDDNENDSPFPESTIMQAGQFRIGIIHGHQILPWKNNHAAIARMRRKMNVDMIVTGNTHQNEVVCHDGCYHINPGSITGAYSSITENVVPSFILLSVNNDSIVCYVYEYINDTVDVSKTEFTKKKETIESPKSPDLLNSLLT